MPSEWRNRILLGALLVLLAGVVYRAVGTSDPSSAAPAASNAAGAGAAARSATAAAPQSPNVNLEALKDDRPKPVDAGRNLFRYKPTAPPPPPPGPFRPTAAGPVGSAPGGAGPSGPPPPPPITLKFIGIVEPGGGKARIAVLSDSAGHVFEGTENGPPIEGRYRILRIGAESIEMSYLDGSGRQTIRLSGS